MQLERFVKGQPGLMHADQANKLVDAQNTVFSLKVAPDNIAEFVWGEGGEGGSATLQFKFEVYESVICIEEAGETKLVRVEILARILGDYVPA